MISYQLFTQTAVVTVVTSLNTFWPSTVSAWLASRVETMVFIHAFAWVFVLSSVIPSTILGKERSVLIQFFVCLALTLVAFWIKDALPSIVGGQPIEKIFSLAVLFQNPLFAGLYLSAPYLFMLLLDIHSNRNRKREMILQGAEMAYLEDSAEREALEEYLANALDDYTEEEEQPET